MGENKMSGNMIENERFVMTTISFTFYILKHLVHKVVFLSYTSVCILFEFTGITDEMAGNSS